MADNGNGDGDGENALRGWVSAACIDTPGAMLALFQRPEPPPQVRGDSFFASRAAMRSARSTNSAPRRPCSGLRRMAQSPVAAGLMVMLVRRGFAGHDAVLGSGSGW